MEVGNEPRLWGEFVAWTQQDGIDYVLAGARMLGQDFRRGLNARARIAGIVAPQAGAELSGVLPNEMSPRSPGQAVAQLQALVRGMHGED